MKNLIVAIIPIFLLMCQSSIKADDGESHQVQINITNNSGAYVISAYAFQCHNGPSVIIHPQEDRSLVVDYKEGCQISIGEAGGYPHIPFALAGIICVPYLKKSDKGLFLDCPAKNCGNLCSLDNNEMTITVFK